jgi:hypothetical protein
MRADAEPKEQPCLKVMDPRLTLELPDELVDALVQRVVDKLEAQNRWHSTESLAECLNMSVRQIRGLRERGLPAKRIGKRLVFDLRAVEEWLEHQ